MSLYKIWTIYEELYQASQVYCYTCVNMVKVSKGIHPLMFYLRLSSLKNPIGFLLQITLQQGHLLDEYQFSFTNTKNYSLHMI